MLLIATGNAHKLEEFGALFQGVSLTSLAEFPGAPDPVEDAPDFVGNAIIKARSARAHTGLICLADDSGLEVQALGGAPGVRSARYAPGSDADRVLALLNAMADQTNRAARFRCAIAIAGLPEGELPAGVRRIDDCVVCEGSVSGRIAHRPRGGHGFGYDPVFELDDGRSVAELSSAEKHAISHRGVAAARLALYLQAFFLDHAGADR